MNVGGTNDSRMVVIFWAERGFRVALEETETVEDFVGGLLREGIGLGRFFFLATDSPGPEEPGPGRFLDTEADEDASCLAGSAVVIMEELNLDGVSDPRSATSCGLVHFE